MSTDRVILVHVIVGRHLLTGKNINKLFTFRPKVDYTIHMNSWWNYPNNSDSLEYIFALSGYFSDF